MPKRLLLFFCCLPSLFADLDPEFQQKLDAAVEARIDEVVNVLINPERICRENFFEWPLKAPAHTPEKIIKTAKSRADKLAQDRYPDSLKIKIIDRSLALFDIYRVGKRVTLHPTSMPAPIEGVIRKLGKGTVQMGAIEIQISDLPESEQAHFNPVLAEQLAAQYVSSEWSKVRAARNKLRKRAQTEFGEKFYMASGYLQVDGRWVATSKYVQELIRSETQNLRDELRPLAIVEVYLSNGLEKYNGEWMPREEAETLRAGRALDEGVEDDGGEGFEEDGGVFDDAGEEDIEWEE